jgi:ribonuclease HI
MFTLHFDGLFRTAIKASQAGIMCFGWLLQENSSLIAYSYGATARGIDATSNLAEYLGLIDGLEAMLDIGVEYDNKIIYGDAKVVIDQIAGKAKISAPRIFPFYERVCRFAFQINPIEWCWIPRKQNKAADLLSRRALMEVLESSGGFESVWQDILLDHSINQDKMRELGEMLVFQPRAEIHTPLGA